MFNDVMACELEGAVNFPCYFNPGVAGEFYGIASDGKAYMAGNGAMVWVDACGMDAYFTRIHLWRTEYSEFRKVAC